MTTLRADGRSDDVIRPVVFTRNYLKKAFGSCMVEFGDTRVLCAASIDEGVPAWRKGTKKGWVTAEYSMLPASGAQRSRREINGQLGRTHEIQRLIGRSLRSVVNLDAMGEITVIVDCDVIQADGGTRTASICGAWIALTDALTTWKNAGKIKMNPVFGQIAAVSVGMVDGRILLDLDYREDSRAEIDMNLVMNSDGEFIEIQGTAEHAPFNRVSLNAMLDVGTKGLYALLEAQREALE